MQIHIALYECVVVIVGLLLAGRLLWISKKNRIRKEQKEALLSILSVVIFVMGVMVPMIFASLFNNTKIVNITYDKQGKAKVIEKTPYYIMIGDDTIIKETKKDSEKKELNVDIVSKDEQMFSINLKILRYYVEGSEDEKEQNKQFEERIKGKTREEIREEWNETEVKKMIQQEVKKHTATELNSKLFLSRVLKSVEDTYNEKHFKQIKIYA